MLKLYYIFDIKIRNSFDKTIQINLNMVNLKHILPSSKGIEEYKYFRSRNNLLMILLRKSLRGYINLLPSPN